MPKIFITRPIPEAGAKLLKDKGYDLVVNEKAKDRAAREAEKEGFGKGRDCL